MTTTGPLRPEEERSKTEQSPEITLTDRGGHSVQQVAEALVDKWETGLGMRIRSVLVQGPPHLVLTNDVKLVMREDIVQALIAAAASPATFAAPGGHEDIDSETEAIDGDQVL